MDIHHPACLLGYEQENYGNIEAFKHLTGKNTLTLLFSAMTDDLKDYSNFLGYIKNHCDVIFVDDGYYGLCDDGQQIDENYSSDKFVRHFYDHCQNIIAKYQNVVLMGQSMGTIIALELHQKLTQAKMVLVSPPYTEDHYRFDFVDKAFIHFLLYSKIGRELLNDQQNNFWPVNFHRLLNLLPPNTGIIFQKANYWSLAYALDDVFKHGTISPSQIPPDWLIFVGKDDLWLNDFCLQTEIKKRNNTFILNCGHGILQKNWPEVIEKVQEIYPELFPKNKNPEIKS